MRTKEESVRRRKTYRVWVNMRERCLNGKHPGYHRYGGRGITICQEWGTFNAFLSDMGHPPDGMSIERKDNDRGYCKDNCVWATPKQQRRNTRINKHLTLSGITLCVAEWAEKLRLAPHIIYQRINLGLPENRILRPFTTQKFREKRRIP